METTFQPSIVTSYRQAATSPSISAQFINWCKDQEHNRFKWLAFTLAVHGCALTPITMFSIILSSNSIVFWVMALVAMGTTLVTNLAALPTKITIPAFLLSVLIDLGIITSAIMIGLDITRTYV